MLFSLAIIASTSALAWGVAALPADNVERHPSPIINARQAVVTPPPCVALSPPPSEDETEERFIIFGDAFLVEKNLTKAFEYVSATYKVHPSLSQE